MRKLYALAILGSVLGLTLFASPQASAATCPGAGPFFETVEAPADDNDCDTVTNTTEDSAPAHDPTAGLEDPDNIGTVAGDNNADDIPDSQQATVATMPNPNDTQVPGSYITIETLPTLQGATESNWFIVSASTTTATAAAAPGSAPTDRTFPVGLVDFTIENSYEQFLIMIDSLFCSGSSFPGCDALATQIEDESAAQVRLLFDRVIPHDDWMVQQYANGSFTTYPGALIQDEVVGFLRTTITWNLVDGGIGDLDGTLNGQIVDPIGPAVLNAVAVVPPVTVATATTSNVTAVPTLANTGASQLAFCRSSTR
jgi:hypothetical protein